MLSVLPVFVVPPLKNTTNRKRRPKSLVVTPRYWKFLIPTLECNRSQPGLIPILQWLNDYPKQCIRVDVMAGLIAAAVVIPKAMAYATISGVPVEVGLYAALVPMVVYAVLGTSRSLSVSTTTTIAILTGADLDRAAPNASPEQLIAAHLGVPESDGDPAAHRQHRPIEAVALEL